MKRLPLFTIAIAILPLSVSANPNKAPDFAKDLQAQIGADFEVVSIATADESLTREGTGAFYYAEFEAQLGLPFALFTAVDRQEAYIVVQEVSSDDATFPAVGNVVGAYRNGFGPSVHGGSHRARAWPNSPAQ